MTPEQREYQKKWKAANVERCRAYYRKYSAKNRATRTAFSKEWVEKNREKANAYAKKYREANPEKSVAASKKWRDANRDKQRAATAKWIKNNRERVNRNERKRCATDPAYKLAKKLRSRVRSAVKKQGTRKAGRLAALIGCDVQFLLGYLEARFKPGMKWSNHGTVWEIDHILPCASFDLTDESHQRSCFHYSNLQPLFKQANRIKYCKIPASRQAELI